MPPASTSDRNLFSTAKACIFSRTSFKMILFLLSLQNQVSVAIPLSDSLLWWQVVWSHVVSSLSLPPSAKTLSNSFRANLQTGLGLLDRLLMQWKIFFYNYMEISIFTEISHVWVLSHFSGAGLFVTLWTVTCQAPLSMGLSRQEYWSGSPCPPPGDLPDPGIEPSSLGLLHWQVGPSPLAPPIMCALMQKKKKKRCLKTLWDGNWDTHPFLPYKHSSCEE